MTSRTIFGREPAVIVSVIEAFITLVSVLVLHWSADQVSLVMAFVVALFGCYTAWVTRDTLLGVAIGLIKAALAVAIGFGLHPDPNAAAALIAFVTVALGLFNRTQTSPVGTVVQDSPAVPVAPVVNSTFNTNGATTVTSTLTPSVAPAPADPAPAAVPADPAAVGQVPAADVPADPNGTANAGTPPAGV